jgi:tellurite resistance protein TerC
MYSRMIEFAQNGIPADADSMWVPWWVWLATIGGLAVLLLGDLLIGRKPHHVTVGEAAKWVCLSVACAVLFGFGVWWFGDARFATEYFTGYLTEYSLSVDNLFLFMVIMSGFAVPAVQQDRVLLTGVVIALVLRGIFIAAGAALIARFVWIFFLFGAFLIWTAVATFRKRHADEQYRENLLIRWIRRVFRVTEGYHGGKRIVRLDGKWWLTPLFVVTVAIGSADVLFALDSIPAIFGITRDPFLVFAANAFALMGLRQLYFLLGGLMNKLAYLSTGLAVLLGFIGVKLMLHALHEYGLVPGWLDLNNWISMAVIVVVLVSTVLASLAKPKNARTSQERVTR